VRPRGVRARLRRLEDERAILARMHTYGHALDYGLRETWLDCWTEDALLEWPHGTFSGRAEIGRAFDEHTHAPEAFHKHVVVDPLIELDGDRARVDSYFARLDHRTAGPIVRSMGRYRDLLLRCHDGEWRLQERRTELESRIVLD
jgi:ketosteroid isomerase-like protein